jgi:hypothetical protein
MLKKASKSFCTSNVVLFPAPLSPTPPTPMKTPEKTEEDPGDPERADEVDFQIEYSPA